MKTIRDRVGQAFTVLAVACAIITTSLVVRRELFISGGSPPPRGPSELPDWRDKIRIGRVVGDIAAPISIITFSDFECPFCRDLATRIWPAIHAAYGVRVRLVFMHWPLEQHQHAYLAARASECAAAQGRFAAYHDALFKFPDSLRSEAHGWLATIANVPDLGGFRACVANREPVPRVDSSIAIARATGMSGTPTVFVNGNRVPPDLTRLQEAIELADESVE